MTNEEKATKLGIKYARQYHHNSYPDYSDNNEYVFSNKEIENACIEMAEWKDSQYVKAFGPILIELDELKNQIKSLLP